MSKYIDAEKLVAKLRRQKHELELSIQSQGDYGQSCQIVAYENILSFIASLQQEQPEVDLVAKLKHHLETTPKEQLEKEWKELEPWGNVGPSVHEFLYGSQTEAEAARAELEKEIELEYNPVDGLSFEEFTRIAKYFFELGLNARKEE